MSFSNGLTKYEQTKRWLYIFSVVAIATAAFGVSFKPEGSIGGIEFVLRGAFQVQDMLAFIVAVLLVRSLLEWTDLGVGDRKRTFNVIDHWLSASLASAILAWSAYLRGGAVEPYLLYVIFAAFAAFQFILIWRLSILPLAADRLWQVVAGGYERNPEELSRLAMLVPYKMHFNPDHPELNKKIVFAAGGAIAAGQNSNEHSWRIRGSRLEILNEKGKVFSRFRFNRRILAWTHTNGLTTLSLKNQYLLIAE